MHALSGSTDKATMEALAANFADVLSSWALPSSLLCPQTRILTFLLGLYHCEYHHSCFGI